MMLNKRLTDESLLLWSPQREWGHLVTWSLGGEGGHGHLTSDGEEAGGIWLMKD